MKHTGVISMWTFFAYGAFGDAGPTAGADCSASYAWIAAAVLVGGALLFAATILHSYLAGHHGLTVVLSQFLIVTCVAFSTWCAYALYAKTLPDQCDIREEPKHFLIVGAGFSGAVVARELVERLNCRVTVIDQRNHIAGNCYTKRDTSSGVMLHVYGPHIFHTSNTRVWNYVNRFANFGPYVNRVKAVTWRGIFTLPINLLTINQFFGKTFSPDEAREFIAKTGDASITDPKNFEEQALRFVGRELYDAFLYNYTRKQWGCEPRELPASVLQRLPVRFNYDDNYFFDPHQGIPRDGYTAIVAKILSHPNIGVQLNTSFEQSMRHGFDHCFYTGAIDAFFDYKFGRLGYRTIYFERIDADGDYQGTAVINYPDSRFPYTRIHEHKHFTPWETHKKTVAFREYSKETEADDEPYYPKNLAPDQIRYKEYLDIASREKNLTMLGRLGSYRYLDMDKTIAEALAVVNEFIKRLRTLKT